MSKALKNGNSSKMGFYTRLTLKAILFIIILGVLGHVATGIFTEKSGKNQIKSYWALPDNSCDVLFVGSSLFYNGISPTLLWNEQGIASYNLAMVAQTLPINFYNLKVALETQSPKVVVLDILTSTQDYTGDYIPTQEWFRQWYSQSKYSISKMEALFDLIPSEDWASYLFGILFFHDRWRSLDEQDFSSSVDPNFGSFMALQSKKTYGNDFVPIPADEKIAPNEKTMAWMYLEKIRQLCEEHGIELVLLGMPLYLNGETRYGDGERVQAIWNGYADYAQEHALGYINTLYLLDELSIDFTTDFYDDVHMNINGAQKVTHYIGEYLVQNYSIPDRRGEEYYDAYNEDYLRLSIFLQRYDIHLR